MAGVLGGANTKLFTDAEMPSHTHTEGSYASSRGGTFASTSHTHGIGTDVRIPFQGSVDWIRFRLNSGLTDWNAEYYGRFIAAGASAVAGNTWFLKAYGSTNSGGGSTGLGGSNTVTGNSGISGSSSSFDLKPNYLETQYIIKVI